MLNIRALVWCCVPFFVFSARYDLSRHVLGTEAGCMLKGSGPLRMRHSKSNLTSNGSGAGGEHMEESILSRKCHGHIQGCETIVSGDISELSLGQAVLMMLGDFGRDVMSVHGSGGTLTCSLHSSTNF